MLLGAEKKEKIQLRERVREGDSVLQLHRRGVRREEELWGKKRSSDGLTQRVNRSKTCFSFFTVLQRGERESEGVARD